jgi:hypothetical protein
VEDGNACGNADLSSFSGIWIKPPAATEKNWLTAISKETLESSSVILTSFCFDTQ